MELLPVETTPAKRMSSAAGGQQGFQVLLEAEKEAAAIVNEARQYRTQRLKDARSEALLEIELLKKRKQEELQEREATCVTDLKAGLQALDQDTETAIEEIGKQVKERRAGVTEMLIGGVVRCEPHLHPNVLLRLNLPSEK